MHPVPQKAFWEFGRSLASFWHSSGSLFIEFRTFGGIGSASRALTVALESTVWKARGMLAITNVDLIPTYPPNVPKSTSNEPLKCQKEANDLPNSQNTFWGTGFKL